ncbi:protein-disulfide reductase DsbD family protein [Zeaxanthinibacter enoshimensis]|uniref:Thiol:disulfide interchange protein DsbD n=1 Tax=Zeaxanthinibacter enoshimensis TaxID=392009 RepID=A0A4R6TKT0_9FLAO|nr:thiol:disulfide interchange protein DsbD [Zeaxanthinibacter enoshimensis]
MGRLKGVLVVLFGFLAMSAITAQTDESPVVWSQEVNQISDTEFELVLTAEIMNGWHVYSQHTPPGGPLPTEFTYVGAGESYELLGDTEESETETAFSDIFEVDETFFKNEARFTQKIRITDKDLQQVRLDLFYQVCKEVCIPVEETFYFSLYGQDIVVEEATIDDRSRAMGQSLNIDLKNQQLLNQSDGESLGGTGGLWVIFGLGFLGGLLALLTPCVFPMIPLTVSFFTKHSQKKSKGVINALLYGFFIVLIYFLLSLPFHLFDSVDSQILNTIATNVWLNVFFFLIFVFFAFSFFGYYELTLPSSWANRMDAASAKVGGGLGIFFMALTLAIVSFSCTGPILGGLLGSTALAEGDVATNLSAGMLGFGVALALPFALFALFPAWLNSLPKSGGWMNTVKVVLGFLELGLALKFLSNADLVGNWGLLKREIFLAIWVALSLGMTLYLLGVGGTKGQKKSAPRIVFGLVSAAFTLYLLLGLFKVMPLKLLSGFPPPQFYSIVDQESDCPLGLDCYKDFEEGLAYAKKVNKPILLDFTGWACVNCRKMEENVWSDPAIYEILNEEVVLISLYVDDRKELEESEKFAYQFDSGRVKEIGTVGQKWGTFQTVNFGAASQPYYVLMSPSLEILGPSIQNTNIPDYVDWLQRGIANFEDAPVVLED